MGSRWIPCAFMTLFLVSMPVLSGAQDRGFAPVIDVTGQAVVTAPPNLATITFSVENFESRAEAAIKKNADLSGKVITALKKLLNKDIIVSTSSYTLQPLYERDKELFEKSNRIVPRGYRVNNSIFVQTSRIDRLGSIIDAAVGAGATRVGSLTFHRDDKDQLQKQAAAKALENALDYAKRISKAAGLSVKRIKYIQYVPNTAQPAADQTIQAEGGVTPIAPGQLTFESFVSVTLEMTQ
jgi:uncharacterized protein